MKANNKDLLDLVISTLDLSPETSAFPGLEQHVPHRLHLGCVRAKNGGAPSPFAQG